MRRAKDILWGMGLAVVLFVLFSWWVDHRRTEIMWQFLLPHMTQQPQTSTTTTTTVPSNQGTTK